MLWITSLYTSLLLVVLIFISFKVIQARRLFQVSIGTGPANEIASLVSAHSNFVGYAPFFLIAIGLAEHSGKMPVWVLLALGLIFTVGRILHFAAFSAPKMNFKYRILGMQMTFGSLGILAILLLAAVINAVLTGEI